LNTDLAQPSRRRLTVRRTAWQRHRKYVALALVILAAVLLAACGPQIPPYWPDLSLDPDTEIVYVAEANGQLFALLAQNGSVQWSYPAVEQRSGGLLGGCSAQAPSDGPFHAAPVYNDQYVFLSSAGEQQRTLFSQGENRSGLRVLNKMGTLQWSYAGTTDRSVASPALAGDTVYLASSDHNVYAIDVQTHDQRWVFTTDNWVWAAPLVNEGTVYIASMDHRLYAVDAESGVEQWRYTGAHSALPTAPALADGTLYFGALDGHVYALNASNGAEAWEQSLEGGVWSTPLVRDGILYVGTLGNNIYALSAANGSIIWQATVGGQVRGTPAYVNGSIYVGCGDGLLYVLDPDTGQQRATLLGSASGGASIYTPPVFDDERLYVVDEDGRVTALALDTNQVLWSTNPLSKE